MTRRAGPPPPFATDFGTLAFAAALCVGGIFGGLAVAAAPGVILGPLVDAFLSPRLMSRFGKTYRSPGAPMWSLGFGLASLLPTVSLVSRDPDRALVIGLVLGLPAIVLALLSIRRPGARLGLYGAALGTIAIAIAEVGRL